MLRDRFAKHVVVGPRLVDHMNNKLGVAQEDLCEHFAVLLAVLDRVGDCVAVDVQKQTRINIHNGQHMRCSLERKERHVNTATLATNT